MQPVVTAAEMRELDRATIEEIGIPGLTLMETAGRAVAAAALRMLDEADGTVGTGAHDAIAGVGAGAAAALARGHVAVVCGPGNNGGDGFVVARVLRGLGVDATAYLAAPRVALRGDARAHLEILERAGGVALAIDTPDGLEASRDAISGAALAIDALFGVGLARPIEGHLAAVVAAINAAPRVLAVDLPSGLDTDTGRTLGVAVQAERTVTMALAKVAHVSAPGFAACGELERADIGIPPALVAASVVRAGLVEPEDVARWLPRVGPLEHKGTRGHVLVIGGGPGMRGAGRLAALAALRAGAGLVTLAAEPGAAASDGAGAGADADAITAPDSVMTRALDGALGPLLDRKAALVIGPGLGTSASASARVGEVLGAGVPAVLDADALNLIAAQPAVLADAAGPIVITPHPGEAARLLGTSVPEVERDRLAAARALAAKTHAVVVLKGARTIVCDGTLGDDHCSINPTGGPALATAGSGDVLAGTIGALLAQGLAPGDAARAGVYVHGTAGDALAASRGRGAISSDLPMAIAEAIHAASRRGRHPRAGAGAGGAELRPARRGAIR